eukprot:3177885-Pleurochrysis_carterae.AAC.3
MARTLLSSRRSTNGILAYRSVCSTSIASAPLPRLPARGTHAGRTSIAPESLSKRSVANRRAHSEGKRVCSDGGSSGHDAAPESRDPFRGKLPLKFAAKCAPLPRAKNSASFPACFAAPGAAAAVSALLAVRMSSSCADRSLSALVLGASAAPRTTDGSAASSLSNDEASIWGSGVPDRIRMGARRASAEAAAVLICGNSSRAHEQSRLIRPATQLVSVVTQRKQSVSHTRTRRTRTRGPPRSAAAPTAIKSGRKRVRV